MQAQKLALSHFLETITLCWRNVLLDPGSNVVLALRFKHEEIS
jgi:hypothetical protein